MPKPRPWEHAVRLERDVRRAFVCVREEPEAHDCVGSWALVRAIVEQAVVDLRSARGSDLETAVLYFTEPAGELERWHADVLGLDVAALRKRAQALLAERFGAEAGAALWERLARLAGKRGSRAA